MAPFVSTCLVRAAALLVLAGVPGCVTGHLVDAGLRYEKLARYESVCVAGDRLIVRYTARLETARGEVVSERDRAASVSLSEVGSVPPPPVDTVAVEWLEEHGECEEIPLVSDGATALGVRVVEAHRVDRSGEPFALVVSGDRSEPVTLYSGTFTRSRTALWIVPVLPFAAAADVIVTVPLALMATPYLFFEE